MHFSWVLPDEVHGESPISCTRNFTASARSNLVGQCSPAEVGMADASFVRAHRLWDWPFFSECDHSSAVLAAKEASNGELDWNGFWRLWLCRDVHHDRQVHQGIRNIYILCYSWLVRLLLFFSLPFC